MKGVFKSILAYSLIMGVSLASPLALGQNVNLTMRGFFYSPQGGISCVGVPQQGMTCLENASGQYSLLKKAVPASGVYVFTATALGGQYSGVSLDGECMGLKGKVTYDNGTPTLTVLIPASAVVNNAYSLNFKFIQYLGGGWRFECQPT